MLTERQQSILSILIPEYIDRAVPIGSEFLAKHFDLDVSPATIRNELQKITDEGYLVQSHPSAGRIPTDIGYRFYIDSIEQELEKPTCRSTFVHDRKKYGKKKRALFEAMETQFEKSDVSRANEIVSKTLAQFCDNFVCTMYEYNDEFSMSGLRQVLHQPEFGTSETIFRFLDTLEYLQEQVYELINSHLKEKRHRAFVGKELPKLPHQEYGMVVSSFEIMPGKTMWTSIMGPKRMRYGEYLEVMNWVQEYFK